jgi:hypothetical protein
VLEGQRHVRAEPPTLRRRHRCSQIFFVEKWVETCCVRSFGRALR